MGRPDPRSTAKDDDAASGASKSERRLNRRFDRLEQALPGAMGHNIGRLRRPGAVWIRAPLGILFVAGGLMGFLPVLGFWMLPLGLLLLAIDLPFMKGPVSRAMVWAERKWTLWRRRRAGPPS